MTNELILKQSLERLVLSLVDVSAPWSNAMADAYKAAEPILQLKLQESFLCTYCGKEHASHSGTGGDIECCGEVGHVDRFFNLPSPITSSERPNGN